MSLLTSDMKVVVTGGSGFIGGTIISTLLSRGVKVLNLDCNPPRQMEQMLHWQFCDVRDTHSVGAAISCFDPSYLLHLAGEIDVNLPKLEAYSTTIDGTRNVVSAAERLGKLRRFIHVSTQFVVRPGVRPKSESNFTPTRSMARPRLSPN